MFRFIQATVYGTSSRSSGLVYTSFKMRNPFQTLFKLFFLALIISHIAQLIQKQEPNQPHVSNSIHEIHEKPSLNGTKRYIFEYNLEKRVLGPNTPVVNYVQYGGSAT
jgi:hypothetical protein